MGLSAIYMAKKFNKKCKIICVDHWEEGFTITHKKVIPIKIIIEE